MKNIVTNIENHFHRKLMIYHTLLNIFRTEKKNIVDADVSALWNFSYEKQKLAKEIEKVRAEILDSLDSAEIEHDMELNTFSINNVVELFSGHEAGQLAVCKTAINRVKKRVQATGKANKKFIEEYLETIGEIVNVVTGNNEKAALYNKKKSLSSLSNSDKVLFSREV